MDILRLFVDCDELCRQFMPLWRAQQLNNGKPHHFCGKLFGDRGYISLALLDLLWSQGLHLVTKIKKNMKNKLLPMLDKLLLRKRALIEDVNDQLNIWGGPNFSGHKCCLAFTSSH